MSKFIEALSAFDTTTKFSDYPISTSMGEELTELKTIKRYRISTKWTAFVECRPEDLPMYLEMTKKQLKHDVYGDIFSLLKELHFAATAGDADQVQFLFGKIWEEVS